MQDALKAVWSIPYVSEAFFPSLKQNFIAYCSSKVSWHPDCIFEIHQLWQSGFSRMYSNSCCSCLFELVIIKIDQSSHKMYSNKMLNFQESTTILNACTKKSLVTYWMHPVFVQAGSDTKSIFKQNSKWSEFRVFLLGLVGIPRLKSSVPALLFVHSWRETWGFEFSSLSPFPTTLTIISWTLPQKAIYIYEVRLKKKTKTKKTKKLVQLQIFNSGPGSNGNEGVNSTLP